MLVRTDIRLAKKVRQLSNMVDSCSPSKKLDFKRGFKDNNSIAWNLFFRFGSERLKPKLLGEKKSRTKGKSQITFQK